MGGAARGVRVERRYARLRRHVRGRRRFDAGTDRLRARVSFDTILTTAVTGALACFYCSEVERGDAGRKTWLVGFYFFVGASLLAKGLVGVVIPCASIVVYYVLRRRWPGLLRLGVLWGVLLALLLAAVWYGPVIARHGHAFVDEFFVQHHFARYVSNKLSPPAAFLVLPADDARAGAAVDVVPVRSGWRARSGRTRAPRTRPASCACWPRVARRAAALLLGVGVEAAGLRAAGAAGAALLAGDGLHRYLRGPGGLAAMRLTGLLAFWSSRRGHVPRLSRQRALALAARALAGAT